MNKLHLDDKNYNEYKQDVSNYTELVLAADSFKFDLNLNTFTVNGRQSSATDKIKAVYKSPLSIAVLKGNSAMNFKGGITGGAYQINEISIIVLKALNELEELVKSDIL